MTQIFVVVCWRVFQTIEKSGKSETHTHTIQSKEGCWMILWKLCGNFLFWEISFNVEGKLLQCTWNGRHDNEKHKHLKHDVKFGAKSKTTSCSSLYARESGCLLGGFFTLWKDLACPLYRSGWYGIEEVIWTAQGQAKRAHFPYQLFTLWQGEAT